MQDKTSLSMFLLPSYFLVRLKGAATSEGTLPLSRPSGTIISLFFGVGEPIRTRTVFSVQEPILVLQLGESC